MDCTGWCIPVYIQIAIAIFQLFLIAVSRIDSKINSATMSLLWNIIITIILYYLCQNCNEGWAWFVLLLPIVLNILATVFLGYFIISLFKNVNITVNKQQRLKN